MLYFPHFMKLGLQDPSSTFPEGRNCLYKFHSFLNVNRGKFYVRRFLSRRRATDTREARVARVYRLPCVRSSPTKNDACEMKSTSGRELGPRPPPHSSGRHHPTDPAPQRDAGLSRACRGDCIIIGDLERNTLLIFTLFVRMWKREKKKIDEEEEEELGVILEPSE